MCTCGNTARVGSGNCGEHKCYYQLSKDDGTGSGSRVSSHADDGGARGAVAIGVVVFIIILFVE